MRSVPQNPSSLSVSHSISGQLRLTTRLSALTVSGKSSCRFVWFHFFCVSRSITDFTDTFSSFRICLNDNKYACMRICEVHSSGRSQYKYHPVYIFDMYSLAIFRSCFSDGLSNICRSDTFDNSTFYALFDSSLYLPPIVMSSFCR